MSRLTLPSIEPLHPWRGREPFHRDGWVPKGLRGERQRRRAAALAGSGILVGSAAPVVGVAMVFIGITVYAVNVLSRSR